MADESAVWLGADIFSATCETALHKCPSRILVEYVDSRFSYLENRWTFPAP